MTSGLLILPWILLSGCVLVDRGAGIKSECTRVAELASSGEHKPAVDAAREVSRAGQSCPPEVEEAVALSREKLRKADSYVHKALKRRKEGNLLSARANLDLALDVYPNYYWVQSLIKNIDRSIQAELNSLEHEADFFESRGEYDRALSRVRDAMKLAPDNQDLVSRAAGLNRMISRASEENSIRATLEEAEEYLNEGRFDEARRVLTGSEKLPALGPRGEDLLARIERRMAETVDRRFAVAVEMEKKGDLETAAGHTSYVLELLASSEQTSVQIVEFARLLGMKLYSAGKLSKAREVWEKALLIDRENPKLSGYLKEVEERLDSLDKIKKEESESIGN